MLELLIPILEKFEPSNYESKVIEINNTLHRLYRCDKDDYIAIFSPRVLERIGNYYLIVDEAEDLEDYWIQTPSGNLLYLH